MRRAVVQAFCKCSQHLWRHFQGSLPKAEARGCTGDASADAWAHLGSLPGQPAYEQIDQAVGQHLEVVPPRCLPPQMLVNAGIAHCATEVFWLLLIPHMEAARAAPFACCRANRGKGLGLEAA